MCNGGVAAWIWLDHPADVTGNFEEYGFWMLPGEKKSVGFKGKHDSTDGKCMDSVAARSMWDNKL
jgi:beta-mannosidase